MRVDVSPRRATAIPGQPTVLTVSVTNDGTVISGHDIRVLGVDPRWVSVDQEQLSLFPGTSGVAVVTVTLPRGVPAGPRPVAVEVSERTPPFATERTDVELTVPAEPSIRLAVDPVSVEGGRTASIGIILDNTGNTVTDVPLQGADEEGEIAFAFAPGVPAVGPGEHLIGTAVLSARRPWFGSPRIRPFTIEAGSSSAPVLAMGSWVQHPRLSRAAVALVGLLVVATVFAVTITAALGSVVTHDNSDRNLALAVAEAAQVGSGGSGTASISGTVRQLTGGAPIGGVTVLLFPTSTPTQPLVSTATDSSGGYHFTGLPANSYLLEYEGAGFASLWYPDALTSATASPVALKSGQSLNGLDIRIGGLPGSISGQVQGDAGGAVLTLELPGAGGATAAASAALEAAAGQGSSAAPASSATPGSTSTTAPAAPAATAPSVSSGSSPAGGNAPPSSASSAAAVRPVGSHPARPAILDSLVTGAPGSAPASTGSPTGALLPVTQPTIVTSQTLPASGQFTLSDVPSPAVYDLVVTKSGYAPAVQAVDLGGGQQRSGVVITLQQGDGSITGTIQTAAGPVGGATIGASDGATTLSTVSQTTPGHVGQFVLSNLATPATWTLVVNATGFAAQTIQVSLTAHQQLTGVAVTLVPGTGTITGTVSVEGGGPPGGVTVTATDGQATVTTETLSTGDVGSYRLTGLTVPGTYSLTFSRPGLQSLTQQVDIPSASQPTVSGIDVTMIPDTATLEGIVTSGGIGASGVTVTATSGATTYQVTTADHPVSGAYEIDGITPGTYTVDFARPGGDSVPEIVHLVAGQTLTVSPSLPQVASIVGYVYNAANPTEPIQDAQVTLYLDTQFPQTPTATVLTDSSGKFTFPDVAAPQRYVIAVAFPSNTAAQDTVDLQVDSSQQAAVCGSEAVGPGQAAGSTTTTSTTAVSTCTPQTAQSDPILVGV